MNQKVVRELVALELLTLLLDRPTDDRVEIAVVFVTSAPDDCMVCFPLLISIWSGMLYELFFSLLQ